MACSADVLRQTILADFTRVAPSLSPVFPRFFLLSFFLRFRQRGPGFRDSRLASSLLHKVLRNASGERSKSDFRCVVSAIRAMVVSRAISSFANDCSVLEEMEAIRELFMKKFFYVQETSLLHVLLLSDNFPIARENIPLVCALLEWGGHKSVNVCFSSGCRLIHKAIVLSNGAPKTAVHEYKCVAVVEALLDAGAHVDAVTPEGKTALDLCTRAEVKALLTPSSPEPLACLASHTVVAAGIPYQEFDFVSPRDKAFISLHDPDAPH